MLSSLFFHNFKQLRSLLIDVVIFVFLQSETASLLVDDDIMLASITFLMQESDAFLKSNRYS